MTTTPNFDDLTPPHDLLQDLEDGQMSWTTDIPIAYQAGARHGWEQARQLWPEPLFGSPMPEDADRDGDIQQFCEGGWHCIKLKDATEANLEQGWQHTPCWQPRQPSLQAQALALLPYDPQAGTVTPNSVEVLKIRRALEQAGEGKA